MTSGDGGHVSRNARLGLILFAVYIIIYAAFVAMSAFDPTLMAKPLAGTNVAVIYGLALILIAIALAFVYMFLCHPGPDEPRKDER